MKRKIFKNRGFTIFELLVVIFVIALISSILIANWRRGEEQYRLQGAIQEIVQNIRKAQEMALAGVEHNGQVPQNYGLYFMVASPSYNIFSEDSNDRRYDRGVDPLVGNDSIEITNGLEISYIEGYRSAGGGTYTSFPSLCLTFSLPDSFISIRPGPNPPWQEAVTITIRKIGTTCPSKNCRDIIVKETGEISVQ